MNAFEFIDVQQNTDEWFQLRCGKLTSSNLGKIMANYGKSFGEPAKKLAVNIAIEKVTGNPISSTYTNEHMQRGHEQEPIARAMYEGENFIDVTNGGFFTNGEIGCSPDGLCDDGVIEIKSVIASTHYNTLKKNNVDPAYKWQCIGNLMFTGREWIDFVSYCSEFPESKQLFICRKYAKDLKIEFEMIEERSNKFLELVEDSKQTILNY